MFYSLCRFLTFFCLSIYLLFYGLSDNSIGSSDNAALMVYRNPHESVCAVLPYTLMLICIC